MKTLLFVVPSVGSRKFLASCLLALLASTSVTRATVRFWTGNGANNNWTTPGNWSTGVAPVVNDDLIFQGGAVVDATSLNNTNNYPAGTVFNSITFTGTNYMLWGNQVMFTNTGVAISAQHLGGFNDIEFPIQLDVTAQTFECTAAGAFLDMGLLLFPSLNLNGQNLTVNATGTVEIDSLITGTGNLIKSGSGRLLLAGASANLYVGTCTVNAGFLELNDVALGSVPMITGNLTINGGATVEETEGEQIADTSVVTVNNTGFFHLVGVSDTIGGLTLVNGGDVQTDGGTLTVEGNISGDAGTANQAVISGNLSLGSANRNITATDGVSAAPGFVINANISGAAGVGFTKLGSGGLRLSGANTYSGSTLVNNGFIYVNSASAFGNGGLGTTLNGGNLLMEGVTISNEGLTNSSASSQVQALGAVTSTWASNVVLNASLNVNTFTNGILDISGAISGTGGLTKSGPGTLRYSGASANTYTGTTTVNTGTLELNKSVFDGAVQGNLVIGDGVGGVNADVVHVLNDSQITNAATVTINSSGLLDVSGDTSTILPSPVHTISSSGNFTLGYAFTPNVNLKVSAVRHYFGNKVSIWTDTGTLLGSQAVTSVPGTWVETALTTPIQLTAGTRYRVGAFTAGGTYYWHTSLSTNFPNGTIDQSYEIPGDAFPTSTDTTRWWFVDLRYTTPSTGGGDGIGGLNGSGNVNLGAAYIDSFDSGSYTFSGVISGAGEFDAAGPGTYTLTGPNTYTGETHIYAGDSTVIINGNQPQSPVFIGSGSTLGGTGTVGVISASGNIAPGTSPGILTSSNVTFAASSHYFVELTGPTPGTGYDQLNVRGTNNLANATLHVTPAFTTPIAVSNQFVILNNDGAESITGIFNGLANNATFSQGGYTFRINYDNDVKLTLIDVPGASAGVAVTAGNGDGTIAANECNNLGVIITNKTGTPMTSVSATLLSVSDGVVLTQPFSPYPNVPANGKGTNLAPFQVLVTSNFVCGTTANFILSVTTASHGSFAVPVVMPTGVPAAVQSRYDVGITTNIPDVGAIESTNTVAGFAGPVTKVGVSLWLTHTFDADLSLSLISPDGVSVDLSSGNGSGANFGSACSPDANRTTFDDAAGTLITAGSPPYTGTFKPEGSLATAAGGTANGNWRLRVVDANGGTIGALRCWSLFLYGADCGVGSGMCELCPNVTLSSAIGPSNPFRSGYVTPNGVSSVCGIAKACPGTSGASFPTETYKFQNGPSNACITITMVSSNSGGMVVSAHSTGFDPANPDKCLNYLGDSGFILATGDSRSFSINVASNATFYVYILAGGFGPYSLSVTGGDCRPALNITGVPSNKAHLDWSTFAGGYVLESTNVLINGGSPLWSAVTNLPIVSNGRFHVTNNVPATNVFYRLRKPVP